MALRGLDQRRGPDHDRPVPAGRTPRREQRPTAAAAVPTLWSALDAYGIEHGVDCSSLRLDVSGGSPLSPALAESFASHHAGRLTQGRGMTETSPLLTFSRPPADATAEQDITYRTHRPHRARRAGARRRRARRRAAWDGTSAGEIELRGATITGTYFRVEPRATADTFRDGWLRAGDPASSTRPAGSS
jgi:fatty-acyl-CoA synthase